jgi:hypothetical protein
MSYVQIEIGGKLRGLKFNRMAMIIIAQKSDQNNYAASANYACIFAGLRANNYVKGVEDDFTFEQVCDWIDDLAPDEILKVDAALNEATAYRELLDKSKDIEVTDKKKLKKTTVKH